MEHRTRMATSISDPAVGAAAEAIARLRRRITGARRRATTVALAPHGRPVGVALACGTRPGRRYWGDCYRRAAEFVLARALPGAPCPPLEGLTLVHGTCHAGPRPWTHAWVELPGGLVFCGVRQRFYDRAGFYRVLGAVAEATYRPAALVARLRATQRYGPWHLGALREGARLRVRPRRSRPPQLGREPESRGGEQPAAATG